MKHIEHIDNANRLSQHRFKYYDLAMVATCVIIVCANIIGAGKVANIAGYSFGAGILFFPLSYVLGDVLTEVYGYARARRVIWAGFASALFAAGMAAFITAIPPDPAWNTDLGGIDMQSAFALNFGQVPRIVLASVVAIWAGEMANAYVMAKMKIWSDGKALYQRTIGSTMVGQGVDSLIFYPLAFYGIWESQLVLAVMLTNYVLKVLWEVMLTPITYKVVNSLKKAEGVDVFDKGTEFTPFSLRS
ncbi:queuosine precursor transporter [Aliiglaciecola sp. CAU 1673]|uniref:queuosine precursor transporter n=1 Tax=Aliiglaciecola sp. CAU 1673 TaxID=3032595 RepID=UPI0023DBBC9B|nr:queuosine precursor transporter [Aliiglaciecola sp. CAU 1673]MDF2180230.1 queuosine precursor transporter [Aliiglaciecola sp. CAU 1673]